MVRDQPQHADDTDERIGQPTQVRLIDLFALMTLCALLFAIVSPIVRQIRSEDRGILIAVLLGQVILIGLMMHWWNKRRMRLLAIAGRKVGVGYCGDLDWRHWPLIKSLLIMVAIAVAQLAFAFAIMIAGRAALYSPGFFLQQIQLGVFFGIACSRYIWRLFPNAMEFYEHGISSDGVNLIPWELVTLRDSQFFADRIVAVVRTKVGSIEADTIVVQVSNSLRGKIKNIANRSPSDRSL